MTYELQPATWLLLRKAQAVRLLADEDKTLDEIVTEWACREVGDKSSSVGGTSARMDQAEKESQENDYVAGDTDDAPDFVEPPAVVVPSIPQPAISDPQPTRVRRTKEQIQAAHDEVLKRYRATLAAGISQPLSLEAAVREGTTQKLPRRVVETIVAEAVKADSDRSRDQRVEAIVTTEQSPKHDPIHPLAEYADRALAEQQAGKSEISDATVDDMFAAFLEG